MFKVTCLCVLHPISKPYGDVWSGVKSIVGIVIKNTFEGALGELYRAGIVYPYTGKDRGLLAEIVYW